MHIPASVLPILATVSKNPRFIGRIPLEIWRADNHQVWIDVFLELGCQLYDSDVSEVALPKGYVLTAYLFDWEAQCQFSGWNAFSNRHKTIDRVIECYERIDLADEAEAIRRAHAAWQASKGNHALTSAAYDTARPRYGEQERLEHMVCYLIDNADALFYTDAVT